VTNTSVLLDYFYNVLLFWYETRCSMWVLYLLCWNWYIFSTISMH